MKTKTKILMVEHDQSDIELIQRELRKGNVNYSAEIVQTEKGYEDAIRTFEPDIILSDYALPSFDGPTAFKIREKMAPHTPFIFVSGTIGEENSIELIKNGVTDYALKDRLFTLPTKISRALKEAKEKHEKLKADQALLESKNLIQNIYDASPDAAIIIDEDGIITKWDTKSESLFGWKENEAIGKKLTETIIPERYRKRHAEGIKHYLKTGEGPVLGKIIDITALKKNGAEVDVSLSITPSQINGKTHFIGFVRDISDRKKAENKIIELNESLERKVKERTAQLQEINNDLESFGYSVSHDLRSPLQVIEGYSSILLKKNSDCLDEEGKELVKGIKEYTQRMSLIMESLLGLSRLGRASVEKTECHIDNIVKAVIAEMKLLHKDSKAEIKVHHMPDAGCDSRLLKQVWTNLISNAFKYSRQKEKPCIEIGFNEINEEVVYFVKDNGAGFDMKNADKLFQAFQRLHSATEFEGTGIGLTIVHRIIAKHGGRIWAEAKEGEGATFYFTLVPVRIELNSAA